MIFINEKKEKPLSSNIYKYNKVISELVDFTDRIFPACKISSMLPNHFYFMRTFYT